MKYKPRRASARWLEDAPEYVLSVHDAGPSVGYRYTVCFGGSLLDETLLRDRKVLLLNTSAGVGCYTEWGEIVSYQRDALGKKVRWLDLPAEVRAGVRARAEQTP